MSTGHNQRIRGIVMALALLFFGVGATGAAASTGVADLAGSGTADGAVPGGGDVAAETLAGSCDTNCDNGNCSSGGILQSCECYCDDSGDPHCNCEISLL